MREVAEGVHRLGRKRHNFYVVVEAGAATVVDAGGSAELGLLERFLARLSLSLRHVEAILITHSHTDHVGFASAASRRGVAVRAHEAEVGSLRDRSTASQIGVSALPLWRPRVWLFLAEMFRAGAHKGCPVPDAEAVADGDVLDLPGRPRVVASPGHTVGHAAYLLEGRRILLSGDALVTTGLVGGGAGPQLLRAAFHHDPDLARSSLTRFSGLAADLLLPGHGEPWRGPIAEAVRLAAR